MEKRIIGIILTILGIAGIIMAAMSFVQFSGGNRNVREIIIYGAIGLLFFSAGIGLVRSTKDVMKSNEHVS